jgi:ABC-2 type transport system ATP-binding protein
MSIIQAKNLSKSFNNLIAVNDVSFEIKTGEIFGLLGPNGAGKTTTIRMLTGILKPTRGEAHICGYNIQKQPLKAKQLMGIVPEMANAYVDLSALKNLLLMGELYGVRGEIGVKRAKDLLKMFNLYEKREQKVKTFSKGMKQRIILTMALMNKAKVLFLDEPTSGLDVESTRLIRNLIRKFNQKGITVFLTTHNIEEANQLCSRVAIMNQGKFVAIDRPSKLRHMDKNVSSIEVTFKKRVTEKELKLKGICEVKSEGDKFKLHTKTVSKIIPLLVKYAQDSNNQITSLNTLKPSLEDVFVKLTKN